MNDCPPLFHQIFGLWRLPVVSSTSNTSSALKILFLPSEVSTPDTFRTNRIFILNFRSQSQNEVKKPVSETIADGVHRHLRAMKSNITDDDITNVRLLTINHR